MARLQKDDFLHNFHFYVTAVTSADQVALGAPSDFLHAAGAPDGAGFSKVSIPELTAEVAEYREGTKVFAIKQPGFPKWGDCTLEKGVTKKDRSFFQWMRSHIEGAEFRATVTIFHWHRDGKFPNLVSDTTKARKYICQEAIPIKVKLAADIDASSNDISIATMDFAFEDMLIEDAA